MAHLKRISEAHGVLFLNAQPAWDVPGEVISITFNPDNRFAFIAAQKDEAKAALKEAFAKAGAPSVRFLIKQGDVASASSPAPAAVSEMERTDPASAPETLQEPTPAEPAPEPFNAPESEQVPYEDLMDAAPQPDPQPEPERHPAPEPEPAFAAESDDAPAQDGTDGLNDILAGAFGADVKFTEVD